MTKLLLVAGLATALVLALVGFKNRHRFRYLPTPLDVSAYTTLAGTPGWQADAVTTADGLALRGLLRPAKPNQDWLLFLPGNGGGMLASAQGLLDDLGRHLDFGLATYAYRGFDSADGQPGRAAFLADVEAIADHLGKRHGVAPDRLHVMSFSLGTELALRLAATLTARGTPPASLVLLAPYTHINVTRDTWWAPWARGDDYDALGAATSAPCKVLIMHGTDDDAVPVEQGRTLAAAIGARAEFVAVAGRGHVDWLREAVVMQKVPAFLRSQVKPR